MKARDKRKQEWLKGLIDYRRNVPLIKPMPMRPANTGHRRLGQHGWVLHHGWLRPHELVLQQQWVTSHLGALGHQLRYIMDLSASTRHKHARRGGLLEGAHAAGAGKCKHRHLLAMERSLPAHPDPVGSGRLSGPGVSSTAQYIPHVPSRSGSKSATACLSLPGASHRQHVFRMGQPSFTHFVMSLIVPRSVSLLL